MIDDWISINEIAEITDNINTIHCDTRDFHCICREDKIDLKDGKETEITKKMYRMQYNISADKIIDWLKGIEKIAGGKGEWRLLNFVGVDCDNWLKYVRMYRNPHKSNLFIVCNRNNVPIEWEKCTEENLIKDQLHFNED